MQTATKPRRKLTETERADRNNDALDRGSRCKPNSNDLPVVAEFGLRGIPEQDIRTCSPDQNVYTYDAWQALKRQVRKGEKSVRCTVWIPMKIKGRPDAIVKRLQEDHTSARRHNACLFRVSQTDAMVTS
jgi:hypothetical protein